MNRIARGALALAAAAVLCLGGGGSMAFWQAAATTAPTQFQMGELRLSAGTAGWKAGGVALTPAFRPAPGSVITYTQEFTVTMVGDTLTADLELTPGAVTTSAGSSFALTDVQLTGPVQATGTAHQWRATGGGTLTLTLVYTWPMGGSVDNTAQGATVSLPAAQLLLRQVVS